MHLPHAEVCYVLGRARKGIVFFALLVTTCFSFVICITSAQTYSGLKKMCCCCAVDRGKAVERSVRNPEPVNDLNQTLHIFRAHSLDERFKGKCALLFVYLSIVTFIVLLFAFVPLHLPRLVADGVILVNAEPTHFAPCPRATGHAKLPLMADPFTRVEPCTEPTTQNPALNPRGRTLNQNPTRLSQLRFGTTRCGARLVTTMTGQCWHPLDCPEGSSLARG